MPATLEGGLPTALWRLAWLQAVMEAPGATGRPLAPSPAGPSLCVLQYEEDELSRELLALAAPLPGADSPAEADAR